MQVPTEVLPDRVSRGRLKRLAPARPGRGPSLAMMTKRVLASVVVAALLLGFAGLVLSVLK